MSSTPPAGFAFTAWGRRRAGSVASEDSASSHDSRGRLRSISSVVAPREPFHSQDGRHHQSQHQLSSSVASTSHREPIRSFINPAQRDLAPVSSQLQARSVREDTAELATYQLADKTERQNSSILDRNRSLSFRTTVSSDVEADDLDSPTAANTSGANRDPEPIEETSEPEPSPSLDEESDDTAAFGESPSLLTRALRRSPPHTPGGGPFASTSNNQQQQQDQGEQTQSRNDAYAYRGRIYQLRGALGRERSDSYAVFSDAEEDGDELRPGSQRQQGRRSSSAAGGHVNGTNFASHVPTESTPLLGSSSAPNGSVGHASYDLEGQMNTMRRRILGSFDRRQDGPTHNPTIVVRDKFKKTYRNVKNLKWWDRRRLWQNVVVAPIACLPAVVVGLLLNILDALSYGMILFPLGSPIFAHLGAAGISIFYVSTIVSQIVFSSGSIFRGGIGSELIEVVPFFHSMALTITDMVGEEHPDAVIATTITSYALSAMVTGTVFYLMGHFEFGYIVGFIPRHILIGCIGGVGWFLIATGFEVTARIEGSLEYNLDTLQKLIQPDTVPLWVIPLTLAIVLFYGQKHITNKYFLPLYIITIPFIFYLIALIGSSASPSDLRDHGWVFQGPPAGEPWWYFYTLYKFNEVHWGAIAQCIPAMFALTFFGILHVPINVPALALNTGEDHADLNHELKLHGYSNFLSGCVGSIQNYLVYANTLFFMRSGGDSRLAGFELAALTFGVMLIGPKTIGFIPVMMVGCLIFDLGFELLVEAVWQPRKKLKPLEYITVIVIVLIMGVYDFVVGIGVGILLAFVSLIFQTSQVSAVRAMYAGDIVTSTVRRNHAQHHYLRQVGRQICIIKVAGYLFFGTIVSVEQKIRDLIADEAFIQRPIRYLILDLRQVTGLDYSAGEAFNTISRLLTGKGIHLVLSGVDADRALGHDLRAVGVGEDGIEVAFLPDINSALELCENELLKTLYASQEAEASEIAKASTAGDASAAVASKAVSKATATPAVNSYLHPPAGGSGTGSGSGPAVDMLASSPRHNLLRTAARESINRLEDRRQSRWHNFAEPLRLMLQVFQNISDKNEDFWFRATRYFERQEFAAGQMLFQAGAPAEGFYLLEQGIVRAEYDLPHGQFYHESIVAGTTCGELPFFSDTRRTATVYADLDCVVWVLERTAWQQLQKDDPEVANELLRVSLKLTAERMSTVPASTMLMAD
ncbi:hypothetical protein HMPREF1624_01188 [Sporothrix schenckii ATCC 58251]|uniref:STAS domain-containing protein n=1 Tax=Sporothrix schenckii (strain ATCC 58251 / de Perez 2211183) TaxID=1391915 RepID=U7Q7A3_SPOS1|nr:hypothetical protein HMPREF1624_01188 [Sporothrix schenckii ATCC 58251]